LKKLKKVIVELKFELILFCAGAYGGEGADHPLIDVVVALVIVPARDRNNIPEGVTGLNALEAFSPSGRFHEGKRVLIEITRPNDRIANIDRHRRRRIFFTQRTAEFDEMRGCDGCPCRKGNNCYEKYRERK
jgi:hypothetical protein